VNAAITSVMAALAGGKMRERGMWEEVCKATCLFNIFPQGPKRFSVADVLCIGTVFFFPHRGEDPNVH